MNILCTICSDLVNQAENTYVTKCGHIFHHHCLAQWIERSKTCPQCRNKVTDKCMFRMYPTVSNENNCEDAATLQSRLDDSQLQLRQQRVKVKEKEEQLAAASADLKRQDDLLKSYEKRLVSFDSKVLSLKEQLDYAHLQIRDMQGVKEENESLKKNMQTLNGLQKVLNATSDGVEQMLQGYSDVRTIATFATALKRALCESEAKKNESRDRLHAAKQQLALEKKTVSELQNKVVQLEDELHRVQNQYSSLKAKKEMEVTHKPSRPGMDVDRQIRNYVEQSPPPALNDAILETDSHNSSFNTMVNNIENSDSPYLSLKQGSVFTLGALTAMKPEELKKSQNLFRHTIKHSNKRPHEKVSTKHSIFHKKEMMKISSLDESTHSPADISYDGLGGHSKIDTFPVPNRTGIKSCIPKVSAKHKLKRPNPTGNQDIEKMLKKVKNK